MAVVVTKVELDSYSLQRNVIEGSEDTGTNEGKCSLAWSLHTSLRNLRWKALIPQYFVASLSQALWGYSSTWTEKLVSFLHVRGWWSLLKQQCLSMLSWEPIARRITQVDKFFTPPGSDNPYLATLCTDTSYLALIPTLVHSWRCCLILQRWVHMVNTWLATLVAVQLFMSHF